MKAKTTKNPMQAAGHRDGVEWRKTATKGQLVRLRRFKNDNPDLADWFEEQETRYEDKTKGYDSFDPAEILAMNIDQAVMLGSRDPMAFWFLVTGVADDADTDDVDYLAGFVEGGLSEEAPKKSRRKVRRKAA